MLREASGAIIEFVCKLQYSHFQQFWLPCKSELVFPLAFLVTSYLHKVDTGHLLVSATTILIRCTVESTNTSVRANSTAKLIKLVEYLRPACTDCNWDLADFCVERCSDPITKVANLYLAEPTTGEATNATIQNHSTNADDLFPALLLPLDSLEFPWENAWDTTEGMWPTYL